MGYSWLFNKILKKPLILQISLFLFTSIVVGDCSALEQNQPTDKLIASDKENCTDKNPREVKPSKWKRNLEIISGASGLCILGLLAYSRRVHANPAVTLDEKRYGRIGYFDHFYALLRCNEETFNPHEVYTIEKDVWIKNKYTNMLYCCGCIEEISSPNLFINDYVRLGHADDGQKRKKFQVIWADTQKDLGKVDIGYLQSLSENNGACFQVASNFNGLEAVSEKTLSKLADYPADKTQGPQASLSAMPGLILRQFYYNDMAGQQSQDDNYLRQQDRQFNFLKDFGVITKNGYPKSGLEGITEYNSHCFKILYHSNIQVTFGGYDRAAAHGERNNIVATQPNQRIDQVFMAALNLSQPPCDPAQAREKANLILRWSYEATLKSAIAHGKKLIFLTRLGGGAFGNDSDDIDEAICVAINLIPDFVDVTIILNNYNQPPSRRLRDLLTP